MFATSVHKWTQSPKGLGAAYIRKERQDSIRPMWATWGQEKWAGSVRIFEDYGTRNLAAVLALGAALTFQSAIPGDDRQGHHKMLWTEGQKLVGGSDCLAWRSSKNWDLGGALFAIETKGQESPEVARRLFEAHGIVVRPFGAPEHNWIRVSPNVSNSLADLEMLVDLAGS